MSARARALLLLVATSACAPESILIARGPEGDADADGTPPADAGSEAGAPPDAMGPEAGPPDAGGCTSNDECGAGSYCEKPGCDVPVGSCKDMPIVCSGVLDPVCGCDGITYYNSCVRHMNGVSQATSSECREGARRCNPFGGPRCPSGARCAVLHREMYGCDPSTLLPPKCWGLPPDCSGTGSGRYQSCVATTPGPWPCVNVCQAIEEEVPHVLVPVRSCRDRQPTSP